jgi:hypothetical protein
MKEWTWITTVYLPHPGNTDEYGSARCIGDFLIKRLTSIASVAWALLAVIALPALAGQPPPVVGVNLVNEPYKQTAPEQEATLRALQAAGVRAIRAGIPDNDQGLAFAQRAQQHGIRIEWLLGVYPDPGTTWPKLPGAYKGKGFWRGWPLSTANADTFRAKIGAQLAKLESQGVVRFDNGRVASGGFQQAVKLLLAPLHGHDQRSLVSRAPASEPLNSARYV